MPHPSDIDMPCPMYGQISQTMTPTTGATKGPTMIITIPHRIEHHPEVTGPRTAATV